MKIIEAQINIKFLFLRKSLYDYINKSWMNHEWIMNVLLIQGKRVYIWLIFKNKILLLYSTFIESIKIINWS
jgi:hypothetical protein